MSLLNFAIDKGSVVYDGVFLLFHHLSLSLIHSHTFVTWVTSMHYSGSQGGTFHSEG